MSARRHEAPSTAIAGDDPVAMAIAARLRHVSDDHPGITRHKARHGFDYRDRNGALIGDFATLRRIKALAIPPAWAECGSARRPTATSRRPAGTPADASSTAITRAGARPATRRNTAACWCSAARCPNPSAGRCRSAPPRAAARAGAGGDRAADGADPVSHRQRRILQSQQKLWADHVARPACGDRRKRDPPQLSRQERGAARGPDHRPPARAHRQELSRPARLRAVPICRSRWQPAHPRLRTT